MNLATMPPKITENKIDGDASVLVVAAPGRKRNSLRVLLRAVPQFAIIDLMDDASSALKSSVDCPPDLLVLDLSLSANGEWRILEQIRAEWPRTRCLILVNTIQQWRMAKEVNVDGVLVNGFSTSKFFALVEKLLSHRDRITT